MTAPIARERDVSAVAGTIVFTGATSGAWTAGAVVLTTSGRARADEQKVVLAASCAFTFSGTNGQSPVSGSSEVRLQSSSRQLTLGGTAPLVDGESASDAFGNELRVASGATWRTAPDAAGIPR